MIPYESIQNNQFYVSECTISNNYSMRLFYYNLHSVILSRMTYQNCHSTIFIYGKRYKLLLYGPSTYLQHIQFIQFFSVQKLLFMLINFIDYFQIPTAV